jgi:two-component sensor histidine kinase
MPPETKSAATWKNPSRALGKGRSALLRRIAARLPLAADVAQADLSLFVPLGTASAEIVAHACPASAARLHTRPRLGEKVALSSDPAVRRALAPGRTSRGISGLMVRGIPVQQQAAPLRDPRGKIIAALNLERPLSAHPHPVPSTPLLERAALGLSRLLFERTVEPALVCDWLLSREGLALADEQGRLLYLHPRTEELYQSLAGGKPPLDARAEACLLPGEVVLRTVRSQLHQESEVQVGQSVFLKQAIPLPDEEGAPLTLWLISDVSALRRREGELLARAAVLQEIHHRVKNDLQTVASLLRLEQRRAASEPTRRALEDSIARILTIASVHDFLSREGTEAVDLCDLLRSLLSSLAAGAAPGLTLEIEVAGPPVSLPAKQAAPLALVVNELVQNAIKHAFPRRKKGRLSLELAELPDAFLVRVADDGGGLPPGFSLEADANLGLQIVSQLVRRDLGGSFELHSENGVAALVRFPRRALEELSDD